MIKHVDEWGDNYRGIQFRIKHWAVGESYRPLGIWNYYIWIPLQMIPENRHDEFLATPKKDDKGRISYKYYDKPLICELDWHCGITYYQKHGTDGAPIVVELGCDYSHLHDQDVEYRLDSILFDAKNTIDKLWEAVPDMLRYCSTVGGYHKLSDGILKENRFISFKGIEWHRKNYPDSETYKDVVLPTESEATDG